MSARPAPPRALRWPAARARRVWGSASHRAAGPLLYAAGILLVAKLGRAFELAIRIDDASHFAYLPLTIGQDLVLLAGLALVADALSRIRHRKLALTVMVLLLLPLPILLPADVVAHRLTGGPITWQRLRGDEGATLADVGLLATADLGFGLLAIVVGLALLYPALSRSPRLPWLSAWARPRSLLLTLMLGVAVTLLQPLLVPRTQGMSEQPLFVLAASLFERHKLQPIVLGDAQWAALQRPRRPLPPAPPAPPIAGRAKNVVVFLAEGIAYEHTGFDKRTVSELKASLAGAKKNARRLRRSGNPTPHLQARYARHGLLFDRYYANWHASIQAIFSIVCSAFPPMRGDIVRVKPRIDCGEFSELMSKGGVTPGLFHGGRFNFYNKLALLGRRGYQIELDAEDLAKHSKLREHQWGIDDRAVADATLKWIDSLPKGQRFAALVIPITAHYPYFTPRDFKAPFPPSSRRMRFLNAVAYQDEVVERVLSGLEKRGLYDDTLFVWLGDHGHYVGEPPRSTPGLRGFYEPNLHTPLVLINPTMFPEDRPKAARVSSRLSGHTDLLPTILDALGLEQHQGHQGRSLLSPDFEERRQFFAADNGRYVGFIEGHHKFALEPRAHRTEYYDLVEDPDELHDISDDYPELMRSYADDAQLFARAVEGRIATAPILKEDVSVAQIYDLFMQHASIRLLPPKLPAKPSQGAQVGAPTQRGPAPCPRVGDSFKCAGLDPIIVEQRFAQGELRRCVMVPMPTEGSVEVLVDDDETAALMTGTIVALNKRPPKGVRFRISTQVDGRPYGMVSVSGHTPARPRHPRPTSSIRFELTRYETRRSLVPPDGGLKPQAKPDDTQLCLQLTTLVSD